MTVTTCRPPTVYALMDDKVLHAAIADLELKVEQLGYCRRPVAPALRRAYEDALLQARAEVERRRC